MMFPLTSILLILKTLRFNFTDFADHACVPDCPDKLKPFVGKKFNTLDAGIVFYDAYAREAGFDTRKCGIKSSRECVEKTIILQSKPKRRGEKCGEMCHHDSRNCGKQKE